MGDSIEKFIARSIWLSPWKEREGDERMEKKCALFFYYYFF